MRLRSIYKRPSRSIRAMSKRTNYWRKPGDGVPGRTRLSSITGRRCVFPPTGFPRLRARPGFWLPIPTPAYATRKKRFASPSAPRGRPATSNRLSWTPWPPPTRPREISRPPLRLPRKPWRSPRTRARRSWRQRYGSACGYTGKGSPFWQRNAVELGSLSGYSRYLGDSRFFSRCDLTRFRFFCASTWPGWIESARS